MHTTFVFSKPFTCAVLYLLLLSRFSRVRLSVTHRRQPIRLHRPWDSPGKNTGVGCHCLFQCMKAKSESEVAQPSPTLSEPMGCRLPGSSVHGIFQARVLEWATISLSKINYLGVKNSSDMNRYSDSIFWRNILEVNSFTPLI